MELTEGSYSHSVPEYSDDTFTSFSDEDEGETDRGYENDPFESYYSGETYESYKNDPFDSYYSGETYGSYENDPFESYHSGASDLCESTWQSPPRNHEVEHGLEFLNSSAVGEYLPRRWIRLLINKRSSTEVSKPPIEPNKRDSEGSEEEQGARRSFCAVKIKQLCHLPSTAAQKRNKQRDARQGGSSEETPACDSHCIVPDQLVNRLRLKNIKETMRQIAETEMHQPSQCFRCTEKKAELARSAFLRRRKTLMEAVLLQEKLEEHLYAKDSLTLIGEIHRTLPRLSEDPKNIWQKLNQRSPKEGRLVAGKP